MLAGATVAAVAEIDYHSTQDINSAGSFCVPVCSMRLW